MHAPTGLRFPSGTDYFSRLATSCFISNNIASHRQDSIAFTPIKSLHSLSALLHSCRRSCSNHFIQSIVQKGSITIECRAVSYSKLFEPSGHFYTWYCLVSNPSTQSSPVTSPTVEVFRFIVTCARRSGRGCWSQRLLSPVSTLASGGRESVSQTVALHQHHSLCSCTRLLFQVEYTAHLTPILKSDEL